MWQLEAIHATNICSFETLDYTLTQGVTTLVFGHNKDNDSQNSNGSGKSTLLEAIALGITGEPLRKVKGDEIINDNAEKVTVSLVFVSPEHDFTITRVISRKTSQQIEVVLDDEPVICASVVDYNAYILNTLGLNKDDIYSDYILCKNKYTSFLSSSDKDKKELINRFSNGIMVDEALEHLHRDIEPLENQLHDVQILNANAIGHVEAIQEQISNYNQSALERKNAYEDRVKQRKESIAQSRASIRNIDKQWDEINESSVQLNVLNDRVAELEESDGDFIELYRILCQKVKIADYESQANDLQQRLSEVSNTIAERMKKIPDMENSVQIAKNELNQANDSLKQLESEYKAMLSSIEEQITILRNEYNESCNFIQKTKTEMNARMGDVAKLKVLLQGAIECPKCHHKFILNQGRTIDDINNDILQEQRMIQNCQDLIAEEEINNKQIVDDGKRVKEQKEDLLNKKSQLNLSIINAQERFRSLKSEFDSFEATQNRLNNKMALLSDEISKLRKKMFDESFDYIDSQFDINEKALDKLEIEKARIEATITSLEEANKNDKPDNDDILKEFETTLKTKQKVVDETNAEMEQLNSQLKSLKAQELTFAEFKTYLANSKVEALSHITNTFLEKIGSDLRVQFSGYTMLKTGKVREKISTSIIRDGIDCGNFFKLSEGEQQRVELACILALHELTNNNCEEGKGLDLLILDEIIGGCDENGLASVFEALNRLQLTCLVVTHGNVAENYPNKLIIEKRNGISYLHD